MASCTSESSVNQPTCQARQGMGMEAEVPRESYASSPVSRVSEISAHVSSQPVLEILGDLFTSEVTELR